MKAVASAVAAGRPEVAFAFFRSEYKLNFLISRLTKPHIALIDGIVMGGGAGLSVHGRFRIATEATAFAMPECAIGLFPDVGTTFFLPRACGLAVARWIALTGARLKGREVVESGVGTHFVRRGRLPELVEALAALPPSPPAPSSPSRRFRSPPSLLRACSSWVPSWLLPLLRRKRRCPVAAVLSEFEENPPSPSSSSSFASLSRDVERLFGESCSSLAQLREALAIARVLGRILVLPRMRCACELGFGPGHVTQTCDASSAITLPYDCPLDHWLRPSQWLSLGWPHRERGFRFAIDRGGTFTDVYALCPGEAKPRCVKLLSVDPANYDDAPREVGIELSLIPNSEPTRL